MTSSVLRGRRLTCKTGQTRISTEFLKFCSKATNRQIVLTHYDPIYFIVNFIVFIVNFIVNQSIQGLFMALVQGQGRAPLD